MNMNVQAETSEEKTRQSADQKKSDKSEEIKHRCVVGNRSLVERGRPVKDLDRRRDGHQVTQKRENQCGVNGLSRQEHVVRPDEKPDHRNGNTRCRDEGISEDWFARKRRNDFADYAHGRENHDVHGRVRVEPEQMLEKYRVTAQRRVEKTQMKHALEAHQEQRNRDNRSP